MKPLASFLEDNDGGFSATRLALLVWVIGVLMLWVYASIRSDNGLEEIPGSVVTIIGILVGGKAIQRFGEKGDAVVDASAPDAKAKNSLNAIPSQQ